MIRALERIGASLVLYAGADQKPRLAGIPGARFKRAHRAWTFPATEASAGNLRDVLGDEVPWDDASAALADRWQAQQQTLEDVRILKNGDIRAYPATTLRPWKHQVAAFCAARNAGGFLLYLGMGSGKTKLTFDLLRARGALKILVVAPKSVCDTWKSQAAIHAPEVRVCVVNRGKAIKRRRRADDWLKLIGPPLMVVINVDSVWRHPFGEWALDQPWDAVVCDEVQRIKAPGGKASQFMARFGKVPYRLGLSGTPCPLGPLDAYGLYRFLDPGVFGTNYTAFKGRYAIMGGYELRQVVRYQNTDDFNRRFYSIAYRVDRDVLDLPPQTHLERIVDLPDEARAFYEELKSKFVADVEAGRVTVSNALSSLQKLQQVAAGAVKGDEGEALEIHKAKANALVELLSSINVGERVVVFCRFRADLDAIWSAAQRSGRGCCELSGRVNQLKAWQEAVEGDGLVLATQIQTGGLGVDLSMSCYCVYFSLTFSLGDYEQSLARLDRPPQPKPVTYVHLIARDTVDRRLYDALARKKNAIEEILKDPGSI